MMLGADGVAVDQAEMPDDGFAGDGFDVGDDHCGIS